MILSQASICLSAGEEGEHQERRAHENKPPKTQFVIARNAATKQSIFLLARRKWIALRSLSSGARAGDLAGVQGRAFPPLGR
jgi:hypothetical protein